MSFPRRELSASTSRSTRESSDITPAGRRLLSFDNKYIKVLLHRRGKETRRFLSASSRRRVITAASRKKKEKKRRGRRRKDEEKVSKGEIVKRNERHEREREKEKER